MKRENYPPREKWREIGKRPVQESASIREQVAGLLQQVRTDGDRALFTLTERFDGVTVPRLRVPEEAFVQACGAVSTRFKEVVECARCNLEKFHSLQVREDRGIDTMEGVSCFYRTVPISRVGFYIPGGSAPLFSTLLMLGVPARLAGCNEIIVCTPPQSNGEVDPHTLYVADKLSIREVYRIGGAQAIGALAYGTSSVPQVDKIFGPGNQYVTVAKQLVSLDGVAIDLPAGPSELLVIADDSAKPAWVAADLLSQAEHGADSQVVLVSTTQSLIGQVLKEIDRQVIDLPRCEIAVAALQNSLAVVFSSVQDAIDFSNVYAPEHLILTVSDPNSWVGRVKNAGSVFLGALTPEVVGDYASGTNHVLPTNGAARAWSGVGLESFQKRITFQELTRTGVEQLCPVVEFMARCEGLEGHARAVEIRRTGVPQ